jgi:hypothetical protein
MLGATPPINGFTPNPPRNMESMSLELAELEAFRLVDLKGFLKKRQGGEWEFQEEPSGALFKGQEEKQPEPSAKEDPYTSFHMILKAVLNSNPIFTF